MMYKNNDQNWRSSSFKCFNMKNSFYSLSLVLFVHYGKSIVYINFHEHGNVLLSILFLFLYIFVLFFKILT